MTKVLSIDYTGPYWAPTRKEESVNSLSDFILVVRGLMEERTDAIAILKGDQITGLWLREPDIDCDQDGYHEVAGEYPGQEYVHYRRDEPGFWSAVLYNFGIKFVPANVSCVAKRYAIK